MLCEETRQSLSLYVDDCVSLPARVAIDEHLDRCPVCRAEVTELRMLTRSLGLMSRPTPPSDLAISISNALYIEAAARKQQGPSLSIGQQIRLFLRPRLMPYTVGTFASVIMFFLMFTALRPHFVALHEAALQRQSVLMLESSDFVDHDLRALYPDLTKPVTDVSLAAARAPYGSQSPSLDPAGALAKMTRAYAYPSESYYAPDDDMLVVADVFSNGAASLADVVHPPRDRRMLDDFESALRQNAAFVKASLDRRPDTMRVVFWCRGGAVQRVEIDGRN